MFSDATRSKRLPFWKTIPPINSSSNESPVDGLSSRPAAEAACTKRRFGQVGPGIEENHRSQTANSRAGAVITGTSAVASPSSSPL
jgi:hypothetical protein